MKSEILVIAEAILANIHVLEMLVAKLPDESAAKVKEMVAKPAVTQMTTPVTTAPAAHAPVTVPVAAPVQAPVAVVQNDVAVTVPACPITDAKGMTDFVMSSYKALGSRGAEIQNVLQSIGCSAINEVRPDQYPALYAGIQALKG